MDKTLIEIAFKLKHQELGSLIYSHLFKHLTGFFEVFQSLFSLARIGIKLP